MNRTGLKACFYKVSILTLFILLTFHFSVFTEVHAAPHITRGKPEPPAKVGKHLKERMKAKHKSMMPAPTILPSSYPVTVDILFLRVEFKDETSVTDWSVCYSTPPDQINSDPDPNTTGLGVWNHSDYAQPVGSSNYDYWINQAATRFPQYFSEVSYSKLAVNVTVSNVYSLQKPMCYYGRENDTDLTRLIVDAVNTANDIDFSLYDAVIVVHAGAGEETDRLEDSNRDIWSLYYSKSCFDRDVATPGCQPLPLLKNGAPFDEFIVMPQTGTQDGITVDPLGIYVHEFGHWLGLPDLYVTSLIQTWDGVGLWSLMGDGIYNEGADGIAGSSPAHLDAWCKSYLGWVTPSEPGTSPDPGDITLAPVETNQQIVKLPASTTTPSQYFLLENRQLTGFDAGLPGGGLLVWLIDEAVIGNDDCINYPNSNICKNTVNNNPLRPGVKPIEADERNDLGTYGGDYGGPGDPFPGTSNKTSFTPPASTPYIGSAWLYLKDITTAASNINVTIGFAPTPPTNPAVTHNSATELSWTANTEADLAKYKIYRNGAFLAETTTSQYTDTTSSNGDSYTVTAVDTNGYESVNSAAVTVTFPTGGGGGGGSDVGCFIATAAYGSYEAPYVKLLREFRDRYLLNSFEFRVLSFEFEIPNIIGKAFVESYYKVSPPIADFIRESEILKSLVRVVLLPLIGFAAFCVKTGTMTKLAGTLLAAAAFMLRRKRRGSKV